MQSIYLKITTRLISWNNSYEYIKGFSYPLVGDAVYLPNANTVKEMNNRNVLDKKAGVLSRNNRLHDWTSNRNTSSEAEVTASEIVRSSLSDSWSNFTNAQIRKNYVDVIDINILQKERKKWICVERRERIINTASIEYYGE